MRGYLMISSIHNSNDFLRVKIESLGVNPYLR
jgi:hypothetical protein